MTDYSEGTMLKQRRFITLWLLLIAVSLSAFAQEKVLLQNKAQAGQTVRYRLSGTVSIEAAGNTFNLELNSVVVQKIVAVSSEGNITLGADHRVLRDELWWAHDARARRSAEWKDDHRHQAQRRSD